VQTHIEFRANSPAADTILGHSSGQTQNIIDILTNSIDIFENSIDISININDILSLFGAAAESEARRRRVGGATWRCLRRGVTEEEGRRGGAESEGRERMTAAFSITHCPVGTCKGSQPWSNAWGIAKWLVGA